MSELGFRAKRLERRRTLVRLGGAFVGLYLFGFLSGFLAHRESFVPVEGATPISCITLAIIPHDVLPQPERVTVNVLNGSSRVGMASITSDILKLRGFRVKKVGNFPNYKVEGSVEVHYGIHGSKPAQLVAAYIPGALLIDDGRTDKTVDVIVGQKFKNVLTNAAADEVLTRPIASPSGPGC